MSNIFCNKGQSLIIVIIILIVAALLGGSYYFFLRQAPEVSEISEAETLKISEEPETSEKVTKVEMPELPKEPVIEESVVKKPVIEPEPEPITEPELKSKPKPEPEPGPKLEPDPDPEPKPEPVKETPMVLLVIDEDLYQDNEIMIRINRYKNDNPGYDFKKIRFAKTNDPITGMDTVGSETKKNSLEVRNTIIEIYNEFYPRVKGVWIIGNIRPTVWRNKEQWRDLKISGFYPSIYPLVAIDENYYIDFEVESDGFVERKGVITGSEVGGGYDATIWGAALIPPTFDKQKSKELIKDFFDRTHDYRQGLLNYNKKLLYSSYTGCSSEFIDTVQKSGKWEATFLCPNKHEQLQGFDSKYFVNIGPVPDGIALLFPETEEEKTEYEAWINKDYFEASTFITYPYIEDPEKDPEPKNLYNFELILEGRSLPVTKIASVIENNLPQIICERANCYVTVIEYGFIEKYTETKDKLPEDFVYFGLDSWYTYPEQKENWQSLYRNYLKESRPQLTVIQAHGAPTSHDFNTTSNEVRAGNYNSLIYQLEPCNTGRYTTENYIAGNYLFYGNALAVSAYTIPVVISGKWGYAENEDVQARFLKIDKETPVVESLFLKNYGNSVYLGDPLLKLLE